MHHAASTIIAAISLAFSPVAETGDAKNDTGASIAQARRLVEAKDFAQASNVLEDVLPNAVAADRPPILDLLQQSYEGMVCAAVAAGHDREAAQLRDNLAIIVTGRGKVTSPKRNDETPAKSTIEEKTKAATRSSLPAEPAVSLAPPRDVAKASEALDRGSVPTPRPLAVSIAKKLSAPEALPPLPDPPVRPALAVARAAAQPGATRLADRVPRLDRGGELETIQKLASVATSSNPLASVARDTPVAAKGPKPETLDPAIEEGDRLFAAGNYVAAGRRYATLAFQACFPNDRRGHWAYCRTVEVASKVNSRPKSPREWDDIETEIASIRKLAPNVWSEHEFQKKVAQVRRRGHLPLMRPEKLVVHVPTLDEILVPADLEAVRKAALVAKSGVGANAQMTVLTASPKSEVARNLIVERARPQFPAAQEVGAETDRTRNVTTSAARSKPVRDPVVIRTSAVAVNGEWQVYETANFRFYHRDAPLAGVAGQAAEVARADQIKRWASPAAQQPWSPPCEVYLYPSGKDFARQTGQPEDSPGFSTIKCEGNQVITRRVDLRADHPHLLAVLLPHEVTRAVLADLFTDQQIPLWAGEGIAVLAEPESNQQIRANVLAKALETGQVLDLEKLIAMDHPDAHDASLACAQSASLTHFLLERGQAEQFIRFVQSAQRDGIESALRAAYRIGGLSELQTLWVDYARQHSGPVTVAAAAPLGKPAATGVK